MQTTPPPRKLKMATCPRGTAEQINANLAYLKSLKARTREVCGPEDELSRAEEDTYRSLPELDIVRADKRHPPTTEDEITYLFINHFFDILLKCWDGTPCLKPEVIKPLEVTQEEEQEEENGFNLSEEYLTDLYKAKSQKLRDSKDGRTSADTLSAICRESKKSTSTIELEGEDSSVLSWKVAVPDEDVYMSFQNGAWYKGRVSRRLMDGDGLFFWEDGASFQGEFIAGTATGFGRLEFPDLSVYEGGVFKGFRHGEGLHCMHDSPLMYSGEWWLGKKHGNGIIFYTNPAQSLSFYKGSWLNGMKDGFGCRQYCSGSKYFGYWKNGKRHGTGIMFWCNNDIYRGEWKNGLMDGFGEYVWNGFVNKTFSSVRANIYRGYWANGRNGFGLLELTNGSIIETIWVNNEKNGPGAAVCPNGTIILSTQKLFNNDKPALMNENQENRIGILFRNHGFQMSRRKNAKKDASGMPDQNQLLAYINSMEKANAISIPIHTPVHSLDLSCHTRRLKQQKDEILQKQKEQINILGLNNTPRVESCKIDNENNAQRSQLDEVFSSEDKLLRYAIMVNLIRLKDCYDDCATMACDRKPPFQCVLLRLFFWELLTQSRIPRRNFSLVDIDNILAQEPAFLIDFPHDPFEKIQLWQFIHFLITISWHMYGRYVHAENTAFESEEVIVFLEEFYNKNERTVLSSAFSYFLRNHIFADRVPANAVKNWDLVPMKALYLSYKSIGEPHSAKEFLTKLCQKKEESISHLDKTQNLIRVSPITGKILSAAATPVLKQPGKNVIAITNELSYLTSEEPFNCPEITVTKDENGSVSQEDIGCFDNLKEKDIVNCLIQACPNIMEDGLIVDMEHQLTFLEYYKAVISCGAISLKKKVLKQVETEILANYKKDLEEYGRHMKEYEKRKESTTSIVKKTSQLKKTKK